MITCKVYGYDCLHYFRMETAPVFWISIFICISIEVISIIYAED